MPKPDGCSGSFRIRLDPKAYYNAYEVNKGMAIAGDTLFWATIDCHLLAIDAKTGTVIWDKVMAQWQKGYQYNVAPLVVKNMVILGPATNEAGANCWVAAYDVKTGKELWRFYTAPMSADAPEAKTWAGDSWKHGGSPIWNGGAYDPETNLTFWGTGNPNPGWNGDPRAPGDNLYSDSVIALDADTGKLKWYFQFTPGDEYDWDATQVPVLVDMDWKGQRRKVMLWANRNGFFYVLDRTTGQFLMAKNFIKQNWNIGFDKDGRPIKDPARWPKKMGGITSSPPARVEQTGIRRPLARAQDCFTSLYGTTTAAFRARAIPASGWKASDIPALDGPRSFRLARRAPAEASPTTKRKPKDMERSAHSIRRREKRNGNLRWSTTQRAASFPRAVTSCSAVGWMASSSL